MPITRIRLEAPYLIYLGDVPDLHHAKTGAGVACWRPESCVGQMRRPDCPVDLGLPEMSVQDAQDAGVKTVIVGVAPKGGQIPEHWVPQFVELAGAGFDIAAGLHTKLSDIAELVAAANKSGAKLNDVRVPPADLPVADGRPRTGKRILMVGTDCAVGKKYSALALHRELHRRKIKATFRATGQTGIMIAGEGLPIDAVVADFISGAAEILSPDNDDDHWDVIEGQGSLLNPSYAGVSLGLLHGSQPDAIVLCHDVERVETEGVVGDYPIPELDEVIDDTLRMARRTNSKCFCAGVSVNTSSMSDFDRDNYLSKLQSELGLPCVDPLAIGMSPIANFLLKYVS
jgi:D-glutamate N-acetyltransferase